RASRLFFSAVGSERSFVRCVNLLSHDILYDLDESALTAPAKTHLVACIQRGAGIACSWCAARMLTYSALRIPGCLPRLRAPRLVWLIFRERRRFAAL